MYCVCVCVCVLCISYQEGSINIPVEMKVLVNCHCGVRSSCYDSELEPPIQSVYVCVLKRGECACVRVHGAWISQTSF